MMLSQCPISCTSEILFPALFFPFICTNHLYFLCTCSAWALCKIDVLTILLVTCSHITEGVCNTSTQRYCDELFMNDYMHPNVQKVMYLRVHENVYLAEKELCMYSNCSHNECRQSTRQKITSHQHIRGISTCPRVLQKKMR